ncbi:MAG TPA: imidazole glycerol phosphate synthase subunit HisH [Candidatus Limnocylindria bacterium]|nr:imidazole glycerol phosphate synthase subunit HisH [Candidatus Limnocylindria bacterium]
MIDFGAGNTRSVLRGLHAVGARAQLVRTPSEMVGAERLILPGVGAAGSAMTALHERSLVDPIRAWAADGRPFLGICLGAQLMLDASEEGDTAGLALIRGACRRFPAFDAGGPTRVPHIGWNRVELGGGQGFDAYFVHGYWLQPADPGVEAGWTEVDGFRFPSLIRSGSMLGTQFHPEKSGPAGRALLAAWVRGLLDNASRIPEAAAWS